MEARGFGQRLRQAIGLKQGDTFYPRIMGGFGSWFVGMNRSQYNYAADVGIGLQSSVLMATVQWLMRAFPEAPMVIRRQRRTGLEIVPGHPLAERIAQPNPFYSGEQLWMASMWSWAIFGNAYWLVVTDRSQRVRELWWVPPWMMEPRWPADSGDTGKPLVFISHYAYKPSEGVERDIPVDQVVHFRHGIDPRNMRLGLSPVSAVMREIWSDDEATNWVNALLRNMAVPGMLITPDGDGAIIGESDVELVKEYIKSRFTGDHRGEPMTIGSQVKVQKLSLAPHEMDMTVIHNTAEERVTSCLGIPAAVVGFGSGLEQTKVGATMAEMVRLAWTNGIIPPQRIMAGEVSRVLLPKYETDPQGFRAGWDYAQVGALQEDANARAQRYDVMVRGGWVKVSEARQANNLDTKPEDEVYLRPISAIEVGPGARPVLPPPLRMPVPRNGNGNGNDDEEDEDDEAPEKAIELKQGTLEELVNALIMRHAVRLEHPPEALERLATQLYRVEASLREAGTRLLVPMLERLGTRTALAMQEALPLPAKQSLQASITATRVIEIMPMASLRADFEQVYQQMYDLIATGIAEVLGEGLDLPPELSPLTRSRVRDAAATRARLIDVPDQTRQSLISIFEQAQAEGLDEQAVASLIEQDVPRGRWRTVQTRAAIISQTEGRFASNVATVLYSREAGLTHVICFDARLGPTDEICEMRNGLIVTTEEAQLLAGLEHPRGTLGFAPASPALLQRVGVL